MSSSTAQRDSRPDGQRRRYSRALIGAVAFATAVSTMGTANAVPAAANIAAQTNLGPNVHVFDPSMAQSDIQAQVDAIAAAQVTNEFGPRRDAIYFLPGTYGTAANPLVFQVGYYTEVAGLGASPTDVTINGAINVYNNCLDNSGHSNCLALTNFWRSMSNLTINVAGGMTNVLGEADPRPSWCTNTEFWAVSQAAPLRRVNINGGTSFMDYCTAGPQYASGGFNADDNFNGSVVNGSQQQFFTRNSVIKANADGSSGWSNGVWNQVFAGVIGAPSDAGFPNPPYTTLATTPVSREKPYLYVDADGKYKVRVPSVQVDSSGTTWQSGLTPGRSIGIGDFYIASPADSAQKINEMLARGKNLIFTPGVYSIDKSLKVNRAGTVVLGLGYATLTSARGAIPVTVADVPGVVIAGITVDAGPDKSAALMRVGEKANHRDTGSAANPITLSDVFFRVGGPHVGRTEVALLVNADNVVIDHVWSWRADHGIEGFPTDTAVHDGGAPGHDDDTRWVTNTALNGLVVNGNNVTATGLFVEHYQHNNVLWNGNGGRTIFFQNELPYDPPTQEAWNDDSGELGWAAYKVADSVTTHQLWGGGAYVFNQNNPSIHTSNGFEVPATPGVVLHHIMTVNLSAGTIDNVVNGTGGPATTEHIGVPTYVVQYP
ncbi:MAG: hypothetical protein QOF57_234 [Frankiaceae bacterium]|nr:hypothetical protein [Frankiaceae bacterium]